MGAGFFPVALGGLLTLVGIGIAVSRNSVPYSVDAADAANVPRKVGVALRLQARGWIFIAASVVAFVVLGKYGGLLPASFGVGFIAALGDPNNRLRDVVLLAVALCAVATVVFWWALRLQLPLLAWG